MVAALNVRRVEAGQGWGVLRGKVQLGVVMYGRGDKAATKIVAA